MYLDFRKAIMFQVLIKTSATSCNIEKKIELFKKNKQQTKNLRNVNRQSVVF